ncbi:carboxylesterase/lipase family protein [Pseudonocardia xinjiangensis]|uniref:carboxylesterase/lipase family protein n=1 Tax=Pseudonocardia xinjiangensis TaxID=75289 RepID=UPI003D930E81
MVSNGGVTDIRSSREPIIRTSGGRVRGLTAGGVSSFKGIPYAAPLDGPRRFQAPQPAAEWGGTRDALAFSASVPQVPLRPGMSSSWNPGDSTDCLSVNVWVPAAGAAGLPVMVWIYGGAYIRGSSSLPEYDGAILAASGVVVVSLNYRVGFEGFGWLSDAPQNRAFLDQLAALRWVQDNIRAFGGDPDNVTIFGESAGATSAAVLTASEAGRGLFQRAIGQSVATVTGTEATARATTERIAAALGVPATIEGFASVAPEAIHAVQWAGGEISPFGPVLDAELVRDQPWRGLRGEVDLIAGFNRDEFRFFAVAEDPAAQDPAAAAAAWGVSIEDYRAAHPAMTDADLYVVILSDACFRMPSMWCAQEHPGRSWCYELTWQGPTFGACHGLDVPLTLGNFKGALTETVLGIDVPDEARRLSEEMVKAWTSFAATGDPGWPEYRPGEALTRIWDVPASVVSDPEAASRRIWASHL